MLEDERCKNCKHWSKTSPPDAYPDEYDGTQELLKWRHRACTKVIDTAYWSQGQRWTDEKRFNLPNDIAFLDVYEAFKNELMAGPEFGCIHFERRYDART